MTTWKAAIGMTALMVALATVSEAGPKATPERHATLVVVVHARNPLDEMTLKDLKRLFQGERRFWADNRAVKLVMPPPGSAEREVALRRIYEMSEGEYKKYWIQRVFQDEATAGPRSPASVQAELAVLAATPGAVAIVNADSLVGPGKVVKIDGKNWNDAGYPLK